MALNKFVDKKPISGIITTVFTDMGPKTIFNSSRLTDDEAMNFGVRAMTLLGESRETELKLFGPIPVPDDPELLCFAFLTEVKNSYQTDTRLQTLPVMISVVYKQEFKRKMSHAYGLIQSFLHGFTEKEFHYECDLKTSHFARISNVLSSMIVTNPIRIYRVENDKITEHLGTMGLTADAYVIGDINQRILYIVFGPELSIMRKRAVTTIIDEYNRTRYQYGFRTRILEDYSEVGRLERKYGFTFLDVNQFM